MKKQIVVQLQSQILQGMIDDNVIFEFRCVTGDSRHPTPAGTFKILKKDKVYRSRQYNAQMNYAMQITADGVFIHEGYNYSTNPMDQSPVATAVSDTVAWAVSSARAVAPQISDWNLSYGNINLVGSHGCIRLEHSDAVRLFDWADLNTKVVVTNIVVPSVP